MKKFKHTRILYIWIAMLFAASFVLQVPVYAAPEEKQSRVFIQNSGQAQEGAVPVSGLSITLEETEGEETEGEEKEAEETGDICADGAGDQKQAAEDSMPVPGYTEEAEVVTREGITWKIPLFWTDENNMPLQERLPGIDCRPVLAFFVPEEYAVRNDAENGFMVTLDEELSRLYEAAGGAVCFYEMKTGITYIAAAGTDLNFLQGREEKMPAAPIPGLPDDLQKPTDGTYRNPSKHTGSELSEKDDDKAEGHSETGGRPGDSAPQDIRGIGKDPEEEEPGNAADEDEEQEPAGSTDELRGRDSPEIHGDSDTEEDSPQADLPSRIDGLEEPDEEEGQTDQKEPLTREELLEHCADNTLKRYGEDEMVNLVELIINTIQPQAVEFIKNSFPAFAEAAKAGDLGKEIGLYIYRLYGDKDGVKAHADTSLQALAYVGYNISKDEQGKAEFGYIIGLNTIYFQYKDEDGNLHIDYSEQAAADLDNSIIHEMFHAFMLDYNRTGSIGTRNPEDYFRRSEDLQNIRDVYEFPAWFTEGMASAVENVYQYRYAYFQLLRYEGNGRIGDRHTAENLLNTYLTNLFILEDDEEYEDSYDIGSGEQTTTSLYVTGYLADLYLGELAARQIYEDSSVTLDDGGNKKVSSETIRMGLNSILERLHEGETLDQIIRSISNGRYKSTSDFEEKFIKGSDGKGDRDSIDFCVDFLNYMRDIGRNSTYIPNGSILFDFDRDFTSPIDRSLTMESDIYQIAGSSDYVASTVGIAAPYIDGGKSGPGDKENASRENPGTDKSSPLQAAKEVSENSEAGEDSEFGENSENSGAGEDSEFSENSENSEAGEIAPAADQVRDDDTGGNALPSEETSNETPEKTSEENPEEISDENSDKSSDENPEKTSDETADENSAESLDEDSEETSDENKDETVDENPEETADSSEETDAVQEN